MRRILSRRQFLLLSATMMLSGCSVQDRRLTAYRAKEVEQPVTLELPAPTPMATAIPTLAASPTAGPTDTPLPPVPTPTDTPVPPKYTITRTTPQMFWNSTGSSGNTNSGGASTNIPGNSNIQQSANTGGDKIRVLYTPSGGNAQILVMPLEDYVRGVVPHESFDEWPIEALKAQAVAARTFARTRMYYPRDPQFDVVAGPADQQWEPQTKARSDSAVAATRGIVMEYNGRPADIFFYSTSVGYTESNNLVLGSPEVPYLRGIPCQGLPSDMSNEALFRAFLAQRPRNVPDNGSDKVRWSVSLSRNELEQRLGQSPELRKSIGNQALGTLQDLRVVRRGKSGMVGELQVVGSNAVGRLWPGIDVRNGLSLYSGWFVMDIFRDVVGAISSITFSGGGWGHGMGMPQWGAQGLAAVGNNFQQILGYYFPGISLVQH